ncbi:VOC family protein [Streptomyces sp. NPDC051183]|uniref:VOC family protein n=1 Tax=Streptomyces sp. NPDC051183 TaxID=3155165 RepID=UPI003421239E
MQDFPAGAELTHIRVVRDVNRSRGFYRDIAGAELIREYGGTSAVLRLCGTWLLPVTGGGPTDDKPTMPFTELEHPYTVSHAMTFWVSDCQAAYDTLRARGARFLTPPVDHGFEVRCFFRDPDGHLLKLSEAR